MYYQTWVMNGGHKLLASSYAIAAVTSICVGLTGCLKLKECACVRRVNTEYALALTAFVVLVPFPLYNESHAAQIAGINVQDVDLSGNDLIAAVRAGALALVCALGFRVRAHIMQLVVLLALTVFVASAWHFEADLPRLNRRMVMALIALYLTSIALGRQQELILRQMWRAKRDLRMQQEIVRLHQSTTSLLNRFCDGVVRLSSHFSLLEHSSRLAALLLRHGTKSLEGVNFLDCLADQEERDKVYTALSKDDDADQLEGDVAQDSVPGASMVVARLKDANGTQFTVHIHHVRTTTPDGIEHLLGIVEAEAHVPNVASLGSSRDGEDQVGELVGIANMAEARASPRSRRGRTSTAPQDDVVSNASSASSSEAMLSIHSAGSDANAADLQLDFVLAPELQVNFASKAFRADWGNGVAPTSLKDVFEDVAPIEAWLEEQKGALLSGARQLPASADFGLAKVRQQMGSVAQELFVTVLFPKPPGQAVLDLPGHVQAGLYSASLRL